MSLPQHPQKNSATVASDDDGSSTNCGFGHGDALATGPNARVRTRDVTNDDIDMDFSQMLLAAPVLKGLTAAGYVRPSPVQLAAIPIGRFGPDIIVQAKSGTGKTCVFTVILLQNIVVATNSHVQALVLAPSREIALQITDVIRDIGRYVTGLGVYTAIGGISMKQDRMQLQSGGGGGGGAGGSNVHTHIVVGTPGRVKALIEHNILDTTSIRMLVLDEADQLFADSFEGQVTSIVSALSPRKQTMVFSATYTDRIIDRLTAYMREPQKILISADDPSLRGVQQYYECVTCDVEHPDDVRDAKIERLLQILSSLSFHQCVVFSNDKDAALDMIDALTEEGWPAVCIAGDMPQKDRMNAMAQVRQFRVRVLVSTDLTARGVDVERISLVINIDVPSSSATYLHRVGRTGRFGTLGVAITFVHVMSIDSDDVRKGTKQHSNQERSRRREIDRLHALERKLDTRIAILPPLDSIPAQYLIGQVLGDDDNDDDDDDDNDDDDDDHDDDHYDDEYDEDEDEDDANLVENDENDDINLVKQNNNSIVGDVDSSSHDQIDSDKSTKHNQNSAASSAIKHRHSSDQHQQREPEQQTCAACSWVVGDVCVAMWDDGHWYRARVDAVVCTLHSSSDTSAPPSLCSKTTCSNTTMVTVTYTDYGNSAVVTLPYIVDVESGSALVTDFGDADVASETAPQIAPDRRDNDEYNERFVPIWKDGEFIEADDDSGSVDVCNDSVSVDDWSVARETTNESSQCQQHSMSLSSSNLWRQALQAAQQFRLQRPLRQ